MEGKNIIFFGTGAAVGFIACGGVVAKRILASEKMRNAMQDILACKVEQILYDKKRKWKEDKQPTYKNCYYSFNPAKFSSEMITFGTCGKADNVLDNLRHIADEYGEATITDFLDMAGMDVSFSAMNYYGWTSNDLVSAYTKTMSNVGYAVVVLPKPRRL